MDLKNNLINSLGKSLVKSLVYRVITISLGLLTAYIFTGDIFSALTLSLLTELVQFINYFLYESVWTFYSEKRLRQKISEEFKQKVINLKLSLESIKDIANEFSQLDTFNPNVYNSVLGFFNRILQNKELQEMHEDFTKYKNCFEITHKGRDLAIV